MRQDNWESVRFFGWTITGREKEDRNNTGRTATEQTAQKQQIGSLDHWMGSDGEMKCVGPSLVKLCQSMTLLARSGCEGMSQG